MILYSVDIQGKDYNCIVLDSIFNAMQLKGEQNEFLLPLFKSGDLKKRRDSIYVLSKDESVVRKIDSVLSTVNIAEQNIFLDDPIFSFKTFTIVVDTFNFFNNSCQNTEGQYLVINDYRILDNICESSNVIIVEKIAYNTSGSITIALRNTKSNFAVLFGIRHSSNSYPSIKVLDKFLFDSVEGIILE